MKILQNRRILLQGMAVLGLGLPGLARAQANFDAMVCTDPARKDAPRYASLGEALAAAPDNAARPYRILVTKGQWRERVTIDKPFIHLIGEDRDQSVIVFNRSAGDLGPDGKPVGTFRTATLLVDAPDFSARNLTIANDFDYAAHLPPPVPTDKTGASGAQAVALAVQGNADRTLLEDVRLTGYQDTLFTDSGRSLFRHCRIEGCTDFIFGMGRAVFDHCEILSRRRPGQDFNGYVAAPDTNRSQPFGLVFLDCRLLKEAGVLPHTVALGRPWRHTGNFPDGRYGDPDAVGAAAFLRCWMDDHIVGEGWYPMGYNQKGGIHAMLQPEEARLYEYDSSGPGAGAASARRRQLSAQEAGAYTTANILAGWAVPG